MDAETLYHLLERFPRLKIGNYPTPLSPLPRLSAELGRPLWIKRDDDIGPALGGNKTRKLEYLLAEAKRQGHRKVVTFGGLQSNHARLTAAAANRLGMETHLFYFERRPSLLQGNLLLNHLLGAKMHFLPLGEGGSRMSIETTIRLVRLVATLWLGRHYFIPVGGHTPLGCLGYVQAAIEIHQQALEQNLGRCWLVTAAGSGGTLAGLMAGLRLLNSPVQPLGIDVGKLWKGFRASIAALASEICSLLGESLIFTPEETPLVEETYAGPCYGVPSPQGMEALHLLAQREGILLDPVYTAKAMAGLLSEASQGRLGTSEPIIFLHTGGLPALFAFPDLSVEIKRSH